MTTTETPVTITDGTKISWCDHTFNPWWGCARVSPACNACYAETLSHRWGKALWGKHADRSVTSDSNWRKPLAWDRAAARDGVRRQVFCASMADVFEARDDLDVHRARLWDLIEQTPHLDWMLLTKRAEHIARLLPSRWTGAIPANVWVGVTAEDQQRLDERLPHLLDVPAPVRFISYEPALGPLDLDPTGLGLVICGGESGHKARPMHPDWARSVRDRCVAAGVAFHFKQWGEWSPRCPDEWPIGDAFARPNRHRMVSTAGHAIAVGDFGTHCDMTVSWHHMRRAGVKLAGRVLDGRVWSEMPDRREVAS